MEVYYCNNLRYLGGRDQQDNGSRSAMVKSSQDVMGMMAHVY
jgi:hypothetical protein